MELPKLLLKRRVGLACDRQAMFSLELLHGILRFFVPVTRRATTRKAQVVQPRLNTACCFDRVEVTNGEGNDKFFLGGCFPFGGFLLKPNSQLRPPCGWTDVLLDKPSATGFAVERFP